MLNVVSRILISSVTVMIFVKVIMTVMNLCPILRRYLLSFTMVLSVAVVFAPAK